MSETAKISASADTYYLELRILGTVLDTGTLPDLEASDFQHEDFAAVWNLLTAYAESYGKFDFVLIGDYVLRTSGMDKRDWFHELADYKISDPALFESYCENLRRHRDKNLVTSTLSEAYADARDIDDPSEARDKALEAIRELSVRKRASMHDISVLIEKSVAEIDRLRSLKIPPGVPSGYPTLDGKTGGWQKSDLSLVAARPAVGKTALMCNLALAARDKRIGIVSAEQPAKQITDRMLAILGEIEAWKFRSPRGFTEHDLRHKLPKAIRELDARNITILDDTRPSVGEIESRFRNSEFDILFVDYAQRLRAAGEIFERVSSIAAGLKDVARELDVPVVALAQLNRQGVKNAGLEHLKGSGDLEQEADQVLILEREEGAREAFLTLQKNRHGPTGCVNLLYEMEILRFRELETRR